MKRQFPTTWPRVWLTALCLASTAAASPDMDRLVFYLSCESNTDPVDASIDPATVVLHGSLALVPGQSGNALGIDGNKGNRIEVINSAKLEGMSALTVEAWVQPRTRNLATRLGMMVVSKGVTGQVGHSYTLWMWPDRNLHGRINGNEGAEVRTTTTVEDGVWYHVAFVFDGQAPTNERMKMYVNGVLEATRYHPDARVNRSASSLWVGDVKTEVGFTWDGALDELGIWNTALTAAEVGEIMHESKTQLLEGGAAQRPSPTNRSDDVPVDTDLAWTAGRYAATHNVYFSPSWEDVNGADPTALLAEGLPGGESTLSIGPLDYDQTYYWRVDEVNSPPDATVHEGRVWSFTTEPYAYPVTHVVARASSTQRSMAPPRMVDGSGLDQSDGHSTEGTDMWLSQDPVPQWVVLEFDNVYALHELWVWNSNQVLEPTLGFGARTVTIEHSTDKVAWTPLEGVPEFAQAPGQSGYTPNTVVSFDGAQARYVRLTVEANWSGVASETGLSEVRFFHAPLVAREPQPPVGATGVAVDVELTWRPGREAELHEIYVGTDPDALILVDTLTDHSYTPGFLESATTYYWRIDEVGGNRGPYEGEVWSFTTE